MVNLSFRGVSTCISGSNRALLSARDVKWVAHVQASEHATYDSCKTYLTFFWVFFFIYSRTSALFALQVLISPPEQSSLAVRVLVFLFSLGYPLPSVYLAVVFEDGMYPFMLKWNLVRLKKAICFAHLLGMNSAAAPVAQVSGVRLRRSTESDRPSGFTIFSGVDAMLPMLLHSLFHASLCALHLLEPWEGCRIVVLLSVLD